MSTLAPCVSCTRHVRVDDPACPFCGAALSALKGLRYPPLPRMSRTLLMSASLALVACGSATPKPDDPPPGDDNGETDPGSIKPMYGMAAPDGPPPAEPAPPEPPSEAPAPE